MSLPNPTDDGCSGRGGGYTGSSRRIRSASGSGFPHHGGRVSTRSSSQHRFSRRDVGNYGGGSFDPTNNGENSQCVGVGTCTAFGMGSGGRAGGCCTNQTKGGNAAGAANVKTGAGCATPEGCRCVNLDDPQKVFKLVLQAIRHINDGEGATPVEIHCYMRKHHRMPDDEDKLMQIVKDSLKRGICIGCLRRRYCDGKYYISQKSSGRVKRKPNLCMAKDLKCCKKPKSKKPAVNKKKKNCPLPKSRKKLDMNKSKSRSQPKKGCLKKPKTKKRAIRRIKHKPKAKCSAKKSKRKAAPTVKAKRKGKSKSGKPKAKSAKTSESPAEVPKKNKCSLFPNLWPNFELKTANRIDQIWDNIPPSKW